MKANLRIIQMALERYSNDNKGLYPTDIQGVIAAGYLNRWPLNPFTQTEEKPAESMKPVPWGHPSAGDFSYWVNKARNSHCLVAYGSASTPGMDNTRIITVYSASSGEEPAEPDPTQPEICRTSPLSPPLK